MSRNVVIIGASGILGSKLVEEFEEDELILFDLKTKDFGKHYESIQGKVQKEQDINKIANKLKESGKLIDLLIYSAGVFHGGDVEHLSIEEWNASLETNITGLFITTKVLIPYMNTYGKIIAISSQYGLVGAYESIAYSTTKAAMINFIKSLALDYGSKKILANCICPGFFESPFLKNVQKEITKKSEWMAVTASLPKSKINLQDIISAVKMLSTSNSITGTCITIDGGYTAR